MQGEPWWAGLYWAVLGCAGLCWAMLQSWKGKGPSAEDGWMAVVAKVSGGMMGSG